MSSKAIVLDANILIRAVLGKRVRELIVKNAETKRKHCKGFPFAMRMIGLFLRAL